MSLASTLMPGVATTGTTLQPNLSWNDPEDAVYFLFQATAGNTVRVDGTRTSPGLDMVLWVFQGWYNDTSQFGATFSFLDPSFAAYGDDNGIGPGGLEEPFALFDVTTSGWYTVAVTNFGSSGSPPFEFTVEANGIDAIPEPGTLLLLAAGLGVLGLRSRRRA